MSLSETVSVTECEPALENENAGDRRPLRVTYWPEPVAVTG